MTQNVNDHYIPIKTRPVSRIQEDLTGVRFGRFVVIGPAKDKNKIWVVKCKCGMYTLRRSRSIKNPQNAWDRCANCRASLNLRR